MAANPFQYHVFISYSHHDREWARRLERDLKAKGVDCFLDSERLETGKPWNDGLKSALETSQHLVVLYSENARESEWVEHEMVRFDILAGNQQEADRRLLCLLLDKSKPKVYDHLQMSAELSEAGIYAAGIAKLNETDVWKKLVRRLADDVLQGDTSEPIPLALVAMTAAEAKELKPTATGPGGRTEPLSKIVKELGLTGIGKLQGHYGAARRDWRPFGSQETIEEILDQQQAAINAKMGRNFRWTEIDIFSSVFDEAKAEVRERLSGRSVLLIDPLSLYNDKVFGRYVLLDKCFRNRDALILVLTPFVTPPPYERFRKVVRGIGAPYFEDFYEPPFPRSEALAHCSVSVSDSEEMRRSLLSRLIAQDRRSQMESHPTYLKN